MSQDPNVLNIFNEVYSKLTIPVNEKGQKLTSLCCSPNDCGVIQPMLTHSSAFWLGNLCRDLDNPQLTVRKIDKVF